MSLKNLGTTLSAIDGLFDVLKMELGNFDTADDIANSFEKFSDVIRSTSEESLLAAASIKKLDAEETAHLLMIKGLTADKIAEQMALKGYNREVIKATLLNQDYAEEVVEAALATDAFAKAATTSSASTATLGDAFAALAAKIGISKAALGALAAVLATVAVGFVAYKAYSAYVQESVDNAKGAASAWAASNTELESQVSRLKELDAALKDGNLGEQESYAIKSELLEIQQSLSESYGSQAAGIDLVNGKLEEEIANVEALGQAYADKLLNEQATGIDKAVSEMEKERSFLLGDYMPNAGTESTNALNSILEKYEDYIDYIGEPGGTVSVYFKGNAEDAQEVLNNLMTDVRRASSEIENSAVLDSFYSMTGKSLQNTNEILENYQGLYNESRKAELVADKQMYKTSLLDEGKTALGRIDDYTEAVEEYNSALQSGDPEKIDEAAIKFADAKSTIDALVSGSMSKYANEVDKVTAQLNTAAISAYDFNNAMRGDTSKTGQDISNYADIIKNAGLDDIDIKSMFKGGNGVEGVKNYFASVADAARDELTQLSEGGGVDLVMRPVIDSSELVKAGWNASEAGPAGSKATVFSHTFSNENESVAINFTPILTDGDGNFVGVMEKGRFEQYCEEVVSGVHDDYLNLQIGSEFTGANAIQEAEDAANQIHTLHENLLTGGFEEQEAAITKVVEAASELGVIDITDGMSPDEINTITNCLVDLGVVTTQTTNSLIQSASKYVEVAADAAKVRAEYDALNTASKQQGYAGNISVENYEALIAASKDYAYCIEYQNGAIQLNTEKAYALYKATNELQIAEIELQKVEDTNKYGENAEAIAELEGKTRDLTDAEKTRLESLKNQNSQIERNIAGYNVQIAALNELTSAYMRWKSVSESDNSDTMYGELKQAIADINSGLTSGKTGVGNVVYHAAVELLIPDGQEVSKYMSTLQRYITEDARGLQNFITDMLGNDLMTQVGDRVEVAAGVTMEQICEKMKITPEMAKAIFNALEMYGDFDFNWGEQEFDINTASLDEVNAKIEETKAKIESITSGDNKVDLAPGETLGDLNSTLAELETRKQQLESEKDSIEYKLNVKTEQADAALASIKAKIDEIAAAIAAVAGSTIGDLGASDTAGKLQAVYGKLNAINNYKIADKSFTVKMTTIKVGPAAMEFATGTDHAPGGLALLGDEYSADGSPKPELVLTDGSAYLAGQDGPELRHLDAGDQVLTYSETRKVFNGNPTTRQSVIPRFAAGTKAQQMAAHQAAGTSMADVIKENTAAVQQSTANSAEWAAKVQASIDAMGLGKDKNGTDINGGGDPDALGPGKNSGGGSGGGNDDDWGDDSGSSSDSNEKSPFEREYDLKSHYLEMEQISFKDYIDWLEGAYKDAFNNGQIEIEDFYQYEEEVFNGKKELFEDGLNDLEHEIAVLEREGGQQSAIINKYQTAINKINQQIQEARDRGLDDNDDYIQELMQQAWDYEDEIKEIEDDLTESSKDAMEELIEYRIDMLKQEIEDEKDALNDKMDALKEFYDNRKEALKEARDEEKYLEEQAEKREAVTDIKKELDRLKFDNSAKAEKRKLELQEKLLEAEKELAEFEEDRAYDQTTKLLDEQMEAQEAQIQSEIDKLDEKLNDPEALYNQALADIKNNTYDLYQEMVAYNNKHGSGNPEDVTEMWTNADDAFKAYFKLFGELYKGIELFDITNPPGDPPGYATGTSNAKPGYYELFEKGDEYVYQSKDGRRYKMFSGLGNKVLNATATDFLYKFANGGEALLSNLVGDAAGYSAAYAAQRKIQDIQLSTGDIVIEGNATSATVSEIRRVQRENIDHVLREFTRMNR